ncbi:hypothetical protein NEUTE2DRAFT_130020 [Neurospora tetrasperma FGSC 2509]|nr:hypothetical protein NEUTE2DRAFT_130020 [Neurospora tetrasperma FGSC 2509]
MDTATHGTKSTGHRPLLHYRALRAPPMSPGAVAMLTSGAGPAINPGFHACHDAPSLSKLRFCRHQWEGYPSLFSPLDHHDESIPSSTRLNIHHLGNRGFGEPGTLLRRTSEPCQSCYHRRFMGKCGDHVCACSPNIRKKARKIQQEMEMVNGPILTYIVSKSVHYQTTIELRRFGGGRLRLGDSATVIYCRGRVAGKEPYHYHPISNV